MYYYEVIIADSRYRSGELLTYSSDTPLRLRGVVTVSLRNRPVTGFIARKVNKPGFDVKAVKNVLSQTPIPRHCLDLAGWISDYYAVSLGESLRLFAPTKPAIRSPKDTISLPHKDQSSQLELDAPLTASQKKALAQINSSRTNTVLLHGDTGSGKTRLYLELAAACLSEGRSVIILTPEIALTSQLKAAVIKKLHHQPIVLHSQLTTSERKKIWLKILESTEPLIIIGPRSALFSPVSKLGLIILDEAHEPAYKQEQNPRYQTVRVASQLANLVSSKVILGSATPSVTDYFIASQRGSVVEMTHQAVTGERADIKSELVDIKNRDNFRTNPYLSEQLLKAVRSALDDKKQSLIYFNRRGTARLMMCNTCGWQLLCRNCDVPLAYHADSHTALCHICGYKESPPSACRKCGAPDVIYKSIGTKALTEMTAKIFPDAIVKRFDGDNLSGERIEELYPQLAAGKIDIIIGTQLLAKGFDLPRLGVVGIIAAETSLVLPDFTAEERTFQLLYQVIGRVGRGHGKSQVVIQAYEPDSPLLAAAIGRDFGSFYQQILSERRQFKFPPYSYLAKLICRRKTLKGAQTAASQLKRTLSSEGLPVEIIGPAPSFYEKRGSYYYWQLVLKSKDRTHLLALAEKVPAGWNIDLDPVNLL